MSNWDYIDVGFQYGIRGTNDNNLIKEDLYKLVVTFNFAQLWFQRRER